MTTTETTEIDYEKRIETTLHDDWDIFMPGRLHKSLDDTFLYIKNGGKL
jgi:hypothetical protein